MLPHSRRRFLTDISSGMFVASLGSGLAIDLGLSARAAEEPPRLTFGDLEPLVSMIQETPPEKILTKAIDSLASGTSLEKLVSAAALANARAFGGEDYVGFHTLMALVPAFHMSREEPDARRKPLAILKILYRNANRLAEVGPTHSEVLRPISAPSGKQYNGNDLRESARKVDLGSAEAIFASIASDSPAKALDDLMLMVDDATEVHRTVLVSRSWELLQFVGVERAHTLLRQSVHYCVKLEANANYVKHHQEIRALLPKLLTVHHLEQRPSQKLAIPGNWIADFSRQLFQSTPMQAAEASAMALAEGIAPEAIGEAISLFANQLVLRDEGRTASQAQANKPVGSCHGDSIGVHACDSVNAWRVIARSGNWRTTASSLILAAYHVARDRSARSADFQNWQPYPRPEHQERVLKLPAEKLFSELDGAIREKDQGRAAAITARLETENASPKEIFTKLRRYAISEDGALHGEKFYHTVTEEFHSARPEHRWRHLVALARVNASAYGQAAPGLLEAEALLRR